MHLKTAIESHKAYFVDCPSVINQMLTVNHAAEPSGYNTPGELVCINGGALFSNNISISTETVCNVAAHWIIPDNADCYTGILEQN